MILNAFTMNCVSHIQQGMWTREDTRQTEFNSLEPWIELAQIAERGCFDTIFLADVMGLYDNYKGGSETSFREAMQVPVNDPMLLIPAMASVTKHLGFAFTSSVLQAHPFTFARQLSTLDHLTNGRVAWNVVTSYLPNAGHNLGFDGLPPHEERYEIAEEYLEVIYKLLEGSWADNAVVNDHKRRIYVDPGRVRKINHHGAYFDVAGPHLSAPSAQRTPVLFQAGMSERGRDFATRHAECVFVVGSSRSGQAIEADLEKRLRLNGRSRADIKLIGGVAPIVGGTEAEANAKRKEYEQTLSLEAGLAHISGNIGADLGDIDPDQPLESFETERVQGFIKNLLESAPPGTRTMGDLIKTNLAGAWLSGSVEQVADELERRFNNGIDGFNLTYTVTPGTFIDFVEGVVPILQERGLVQHDYAEGSLRRKLFGDDRLPTTHPVAGFRC
jgi:FMN-dependent oxidoreductase (nitrilotriacetate monooxygenase family)